MSWVEAIPALVVAGLWLLAPGVLTSYAFGLRGIAAWAVAPAISTALIALAAIVAGLAGWSWSALSAASLAAVPAAVILGVRAIRRHPFSAAVPADPLRVRLAGWLGLLPGVLVGLIIVARGFRSPDNLSQTYDAVFHYNALRWIVASGDASSLTLGAIGPHKVSTFYPGAWHDLASLVVLGGTPLAVAANATAGVIAAVVWPLACLFLSRQVFGRSLTALAITGTVSAGFAAFPWGLLNFGVLWPNALGFALVPIGVGAGLSILRMTNQDTLTPGRAWFILVTTVVATAFAQPNTTFSLVAILLVPALFALTQWLYRQYCEGRVLRGVLTAVAVVTVSVLGWVFVHSLEMVTNIKDFQWAPFTSIPHAVGAVLLNATNGREPLWLLSAAVVAGILFAFRRRTTAWVPFTHAGIAALFVMTAAVQSSTTHIFTGFWYNDSYRLAATLPITGVLLAVAGVTWSARALSEQLSRSGLAEGSLRRLRSVPALTAVLGVLLLLVTATWYRQWAVSDIHHAYHAPGHVESTLVDPAELAFYSRIADRIPDGTVVANNPWDGSAMLWALTGTRVLFPQLNQSTWSDEQRYLAQHLHEAARNPKVCRLANELDVGYVVRGTFRFWVDDNRIQNYPGLTHLARHRGFALVAEQGKLKLFRITACDNSLATRAPAPDNES